ncbi:unnamed protein product [Prorocentrum cordatum]|uniref:Uncharacterized protein n=1 Tax=Prorocentrum cordatum TaxID=2364126 RepID=A0ABN9SWZ0_9DINO|nr:unnamed protein product [Polarella glacialis]
MCSGCRGWNWDWRARCMVCRSAAPPWAKGSGQAMRAAPAAPQPKADVDGWVEQPRGRRARQALGAARAPSQASGASSRSKASAGTGAGKGSPPPSSSGPSQVERLQAAVEQLEALHAAPPEGVASCFTEAVASQLEVKRGELEQAYQAAAEVKSAALPRAARMREEAWAARRAERKLNAARRAVEEKREARDAAEDHLQHAQEKLAILDNELEVAIRDLRVLKDEARDAEGLLTQLDGLHLAWQSNSFETTRAAARTQMAAVREQLAGPRQDEPRRKQPWAASCPMEDHGRENEDEPSEPKRIGAWAPRPGPERGQAERQGDAKGSWPHANASLTKKLAAEAAEDRPLVLGDGEAGWAHGFDAAVALSSGRGAVGLNLDTTKFYENPRHGAELVESFRAAEQVGCENPGMPARIDNSFAVSFGKNRPDAVGRAANLKAKLRAEGPVIISQCHTVAAAVRERARGKGQAQVLESSIAAKDQAPGAAVDVAEMNELDPKRLQWMLNDEPPSPEEAWDSSKPWAELS